MSICRVQGRLKSLVLTAAAMSYRNVHLLPRERAHNVMLMWRLTSRLCQKIFFINLSLFTSLELSTPPTVRMLFVETITINDILQIMVDLGKKLKGCLSNNIFKNGVPGILEYFILLWKDKKMQWAKRIKKFIYL